MKKRGIRFVLTLFLLLMAFGTAAQAGEKVTAAASTAAAAKKGWKKENGKKYYVNAAGKHKTGWFSYKGKKYYLDPKADGAAAAGLKKIGGKYYCFNKKGEMLTDRRAYPVGKSHYVIDSKGVARKMSAAEELTVQLLQQLPQPRIRTSFDWAAKLPYQAIDTNGKTPQYFASYGLLYKRGDCNVQACLFYYFAKVLGYDAHYVKGTVPQANGTDGKHAWVEIDLNGKTYVCDPNLAGQYASVYGKNTGWMFQYGAKHTYKYQNIVRVN